MYTYECKIWQEIVIHLEKGLISATKKHNLLAYTEV